MLIRKPAVAGQFYPASKSHLESEVRKYLSASGKKRDCIGVVSPHAGYIYSGPVAGALFASVNVPQRVIVISPNHTGEGAAAAIMPEGIWEMPSGNVEIDSALSKELMANCSDLKADIRAHIAEHSLEVQLPFLQYCRPDLKIVPLTVSHLRFDICDKIGKAIAKTIKADAVSHKEGILIVASSDMTHYEPQTIAKTKDKLAIERVLALDPKGLLDICAKERITMCGVIPATIMLIAAKELGATKGELIKYATSGDISGEMEAVVGYAGMMVY
jgi:AmmeMemoRadiSam system protein B